MTPARTALAVTIAVAAVVATGLVRPYFAVGTDEPAVVHASLGLHPAWSPPTSREAYEVLRRRFPDRFAGDAASLPAGELGRVVRVRPNLVRWALQWLATLGVAAACLWAVLPRRRLTRGRVDRAQYSAGSAASSAAENTGPSLHT